MTRAWVGTLVARAAAVTAVAAWGLAVVSSQETPRNAVFTARQADEGKAAYAARCASCHMPDLSGNNDVPALAGASFLSIWGSRSTRDLFDYSVGAMPPGGPPLTPEAGASIVAHVLRVNGASPGERVFEGSTAVPIAALVAAGQERP